MSGAVGTVPDWRTLVAHQQPEWPDRARLGEVVGELARCSPVVTSWECDALTSRLAKVAEGRAFLLQGGDCAERLDNVSSRAIRSKLRLLQQMSVILAAGSGLPVTTVGRIAGQYAKPRSSPTETVDGLTLPVYRGDAVNGTGFTRTERLPDPVRLRRVYDASKYTLDVLRTSGAEVFTSHEGLLLDYEEALTRPDRRSGRRYAGSGHLLWIGDRTRQLDGAHVAYFATIDNPIAVKLGPATTPEHALALIDRLDPDRRPGRLTFVVRMGAQRVRDLLPELVEKVTASGAPVTWVSDPMHGNTFTAPSGHKTRRFGDVLAEVAGFVEVHRALGTHPGGLHVELTGEDVTECVGGAVGLDDLHRSYESACDPRLNADQALELAVLVAEMLR
ncbi:phospho-2-dehydro-3-deoxyheptonate aldolase [Lentzea guizhouensis]|uniref:Phospho-2-dehydro-3-deoxyheptonate aldolase n=1 Tax=Lentzea guizhouensis TaxID=1586287 RepID=A0A1B2HUW6_9PSEU|nr:3-deoxy-7-phosphoheptulonate synthase class II [Lentzea guizhouensis]ANZ41493.1 phospho-2-dehydro-3-deoxyheptonate aldolase [Lentzea guizhouensis]